MLIKLPLLGVLSMNRSEMTKNFVFREFECGLSVEEAAKLCFKTESEVKQWHAGEKIPPICKRLMRGTQKRAETGDVGI
ncbi:repressor 1 [Vibrio phage VSK]|uniref:Repressor 1 n=1 Tax=Vibrio phage VSK TaxID=181604 RepID=Q8W6C8_9VIRU|nr:repressor 1 [Vibrio phage VSK]AAL49733.1 repressor 1 [Vibrio phage VSK]